MEYPLLSLQMVRTNGFYIWGDDPIIMGHFPVCLKSIYLFVLHTNEGGFKRNIPTPE